MSVLQSLDQHPQWLHWTQENMARGCDPAGLKSILLDNGFDPVSIDQVLTSSFTALKTLARSAFLQTGGQSQTPIVCHASPVSTGQSYLSRTFESQGEAIFLQDPLNPALVSQVMAPQMQLYLIADFMSAMECQDIIEVGTRQLRTSTVSFPDQPALSGSGHGVQQLADQSYVDLSFRTSQTCDLDLLNHPKVLAMDHRIAQTLGINLTLSEGTQLQRYRVGEQFKAHTDYFAPQSDEYVRFATKRGNRTWTFMVYLNEVKLGGGTQFLSINKTIQPRQGMAVVWNNRLPSGAVNPETLHAGLPVIEGEKFVITKWFCERQAECC